MSLIILCILNVICGISLLLVAHDQYHRGYFVGGVICDVVGVLAISYAAWVLYG